ncbi:hypothetical protein CcaverHIS002_0404200 [Cutaneotrichosporon cavernicola]|uniref:Thioredoxin-like fold domain-containing protein n=1 Tax=Cutaneotrichosporon cavernicola TaxID=279322 RepID=A0AA48L427_9TREE|nr:uncharacterized protein CcaverHIS019_0404160 [Cutaneotrichosporon cavernicola]BEI83816.1 hypothetical protein CcaverHIS002_0404200 [Cutaneotrichosporon cavernicola]BEI91596.1 hypothetical protein CcaverHIS019_0404160 [Cutaneotrichosporon cavernicola]BEI99373.1 hypothetical protein CcaverHIS631_0404160 [Cutaneotrichosporon cavernicola]BEJ07148.1 hypothetical protein CcaverHIS641_0404170 [Cutaneotrichosporon cavernicola]
MASPIHNILFSPPPSPPSEIETGDYSHFNTIMTSLGPRSKSPLSRQHHDVDIEAGERVSKSFTQRNPILAKMRLVVQRFTPNLPAPILRLFAFVAFLFIFASFVTSVILPALSPLPQTRGPSPIAKKPQWTPKAYVPPQEDAHPIAAPNPRAFRPDPHPLPSTHELLALQTFILESPANNLRDVDATQPLDAAHLLGTHAARRLGNSGSSREKKWLKELSDQHSHTVVLWYSSISTPHSVLEGISARHGEGRRPTLISTIQRKDGETIEGILSRLGHDLSAAPVLVLGGEVFDATEEGMKVMRESGDLAERLAQIGWTS